jgi:hypothetical protein
VELPPTLAHKLQTRRETLSVTNNLAYSGGQVFYGFGKEKRKYFERKCSSHFDTFIQI